MYSIGLFSVGWVWMVSMMSLATPRSRPLRHEDLVTPRRCLVSEQTTTKDSFVRARNLVHDPLPQSLRGSNLADAGDWMVRPLEF